MTVDMLNLRWLSILPNKNIQEALNAQEKIKARGFSLGIIEHGN